MNNLLSTSQNSSKYSVVKLASHLCPEIKVDVTDNTGKQSFTIEDAEDFFHCEGIVNVSAPNYWPDGVKCPADELLIDVWILESYYMGEEEFKFTEEESKNLCVEIAGRVSFG